MGVPTISPQAPPSPHPLRIPHFRRLWIGSAISLFGDQFYFVALPWLALQLTGSGLALGTVLMAAAIPRAVFMLMGGAVSDRVSPRRVLILTASGRALLVAAIAALLYLHRMRLWELYFLAFAFGFADAFSFPASQALMPTLVAPEQLPAANALMGGAQQISTIAGPAPAGLIVKRWGIAAAFFIDAVSFLFVIAPLARLPESAPSGAPAQSAKGMGHAILEGLRYVGNDPPMRSLMLLVAALNFAAAGPLVVGLAALAKQRFASATVFGTLLSSLAAGGVIGTFLPAVIEKQRHRGAILLGFSSVVGLGMAAIAFLHHVTPIALILAAMGMGSGLVNVNLQAWFQARVERALLGRVVSVLIFSAVGLLPLSYALAGALVQVNVALLFLVAGALVAAVAAVAWMNPSVRAIE